MTRVLERAKSAFEVAPPAADPDAIVQLKVRHGNQQRAGEGTVFFEDGVDDVEVSYPNLSKFKRAAHEFAVDIASNADGLINYGECYRLGDRLSPCLA